MENVPKPKYNNPKAAENFRRSLESAAREQDERRNLDAFQSELLKIPVEPVEPTVATDNALEDIENLDEPFVATEEMLDEPDGQKRQRAA